VDRQPIFFREPNYRYFVEVVRKSLQRHAIDLIAYCLMPNHFHVLLRSRLDDAPRKFMSSVQGSYAQAINRQRGRSGPLFQGRFRCVRVECDEQLMHVAGYIHLNPVRAGLVVRPQDWVYSNYADVIGMRTGGISDSALVPGQFATGDAYGQFACAPAEAPVGTLQTAFIDWSPGS